jgi:hypothetical protein
MFKTMGCLVSAMTVTGVLLSWLSPSSGFVSEETAVRFAIDAARAAVHASDAPDRASWRGVEIVAGAATASAGAMLAARTKHEDCHFSIDDEGDADPLGPWFAAVPARSGIVRIRVSQPDLLQPMTPRQWLTVRSLIAAINERVPHPGPSLPIRLHADWARVYGVSEDAVFELAASDLPG